MKCIVNKLFIGALFLLGALVCSCQNTTENTVESSVEGKDTLGFKYIDIVHITHTDYGYTDHALIAVDLHKRFIDVALDLALKTKDEIPENRFAWTVEALDPFYSWWNSASEDRRESMLDMIENKQIGINAMPFHIHPYANKEQWDEMFDWIPKDMWSQLDIEVGMQHDVNGFPRAAATRLLDRDIHYIWTGINPHWGGSPVEQPGAFWWLLVVAVTNSSKHDFSRCKSTTCKFLSRDTKSARDKNGTKPRKNKVKNTSPEISLVEYLCFVCKGTNLSLEKRGEIPISLIHNSFSYHCTPNVVIASDFDLKRLGLRKLGVKFCFAL